MSSLHFRLEGADGLCTMLFLEPCYEIMLELFSGHISRFCKF
jgi:hypothetical protein